MWMAEVGICILVLSSIVLFSVPQAMPQPAVMVTADPVTLGSFATLVCTVDSSMLGGGVSISSLQYEWTIGDVVMQTKSSLNTFFISTVGVNDARTDYGCDVFMAGQEEPLFERVFGSLHINIPSFSMTFIQTTLIHSPINYVGQNATYSCRSVVTFSLSDLEASVEIFSPDGARIEHQSERVRIAALVQGSNSFERTLSFSPLSAADNGEYRCTGNISLRIENPLITVGQGDLGIRQIRVFDPSLSVTLSSSTPTRLLDIPPYNSLTLTCTSEVSVRAALAPVAMEILWMTATGDGSSPTTIAPEAFTTNMQIGAITSTLSVNASQPGNNTYYCQVILNVFPAADLLNRTQSFTVEVLGPTPPLPPAPIVPNATLFHNETTIQWRVASLSYGPEEYQVFYGIRETELTQESEVVSSGSNITRIDFDLSVELLELSPFTTYYYTVQASNLIASSQSSVQEFTTIGLSPSSPRNLVAEPHSDTPTTYYFSWDPPTEANGEIQEYLLTCEAEDEESSISNFFGADMTSGMLELSYDVQYNCSLQARNEGLLSLPSNVVSLLNILNTPQTSESPHEASSFPLLPVVVGVVIGGALIFAIVLFFVILSATRRIKLHKEKLNVLCTKITEAGSTGDEAQSQVYNTVLQSKGDILMSANEGYAAFTTGHKQEGTFTTGHKQEGHQQEDDDMYATITEDPQQEGDYDYVN